MAILEFYFETKTFTKNVKGELFGFTDFLCKPKTKNKIENLFTVTKLLMKLKFF